MSVTVHRQGYHKVGWLLVYVLNSFLRILDDSLADEQLRGEAASLMELH